LTVSVEIFEGTNHGSVIPLALSRGLQRAYCYVDDLPNVCKLIDVQPVYSVIDTDFSAGKTFTTPKRLRKLQSQPSFSSATVEFCRNMEVTVLQAVAVLDGPIWIQLQCGDSIGWVQKNWLED
jgi:hypothetical protein